MPSSDRTSPARIVPRSRAGQASANGHGRPKLTDAAKLSRPPGPRSTAAQLGPHLYRLPVSAGVWAISTDESPDAPLPRGLYQQERDPDGGEPRYSLRSDLPYVHARIVRRDGSGRRIDTDYLISGERDGPRVQIPAVRVRSGDWAGAVGLNPSADRKVIDAAGTAIFYMRPLTGDYAGEREAVPRIGPDGKVTVPVAETLPNGYFLTGALSRPEALARWRQRIVPVATGNPKMALVLGACVSAPYLGALARQSHIVNMDGDSDQGKGTTMKVAAGIWGNPFIKGGVLSNWSGTKVRLPRRLGLLGILPAFLDERGLADFTTPAQWGQAIYSITEGPRETAERVGSGLRLTAPWDGVMISAGNGSMLDGLGAGPYAGVSIKRVVSLQAPFTRSADEAEAVTDALRDAYGHPGLAVIERFTATEVDRLIQAAIPLVGMPAGGNPRSLAKNLHGHVAGAAMLDQVLGTGSALRDAAAGAARDYLTANGHDPEHDTDRLLTLIRESMASQPARWPTVAEYREHKLPRPEYGQDGRPEPGRIELPQHGVDRSIAGVRADDGSWFAVVGSALDELLTRAGADRAQALAEADRRGWLHRTASDRADQKLGTKILHIPGRPYRFDLPADDDGQDTAEPPAAGPGPIAPEPSPARCPGCEYLSPMHAPDCPDLLPLPPEPEPDELAALAEREDQAHGPAGLAAVEPGPESHGEPRTVPSHAASSASPAPAGLAPSGMASGPGPIEPPFTGAVRAYLADCASSPVPLDSRYHPTAEGACKMIIHRGRAEADAIRAAFERATEDHGRAGRGNDLAVPVATMEPALIERESPAVAEPTIVPIPAEAAPNESAGPAPDDSPGQAPGPARERSEPRPRPAGAAELAAFASEVASSYPAAEPGDISAALDLFHEAWGLRFIRSASWTGITTLRRDVALFGSKSAPEPRTAPVLAEIRAAGPVRHRAFTVPGQKIRAGLHFTAWDINGQHPAAAGSTYLGTGEPEYTAGPRTIAPFLSMPGYVQLGQRLRTGHPAYQTLAKGEWVTMPHVKFLSAELRLDITAAGVVYWGRGNASKHLATFTARYRKAREALRDRPGLPAEYARTVIKAVGNKTIGMLNSEDHNRTEFHVPDWYDQAVSTAEANLLRHLRKIERAGGGLPFGKCADAAWWVSGTERNRPAGLEESAQLGKWKLEKWGLVTDAIVSAYRDHDYRALQHEIKAADTARRGGGQS